MVKKGLLLLNIGSPVSYKVKDVKKYLETFLMDENIIDIPFLFRWLLVYGIIAPKRAPISAENYKKIWINEKGSPLTVYTDSFALGLQIELGSGYEVQVGMRYSKPSIFSALQAFKDKAVEEIIAVPLYPQFAEATTGSSYRAVLRHLKDLKMEIPVNFLPPFFDSSAFIKNTARKISEVSREKVDHYLFSFHGLPEKHIQKVQGCLQSPDCCFTSSSCTKNCYRAQCFATAKNIAQYLKLPSNQWSVSFQSRLGKAEWIKPATDQAIADLAKSGKRNLAVICPSFVADCIETLEEIGMGGKETFLHHGGLQFHLVPCLNDDSGWVRDFADLVASSSKSTAPIKSL